MSGWVKLHRSLLDWEWYSDCNVVYTFVHLLLEANWEDKKWRGIVIPRGSLLTSLSKLAKELKLSVQQLRTVFNKLQKTNDITIKSTNGYSLIIVVNYDLYQASSEEATHPSTSGATNEQQANQQTKNKNSTNEITHGTTNEQQAKSVDNKRVAPSHSFMLNKQSNTPTNKPSTSGATNEATITKEDKEYNNIYNNTPLTPQEDEGEKKVMEKAYAFEGEFVKLNQKDFNRWKQAFPNVELEGFLTSYDAWLKKQPEKVQKDWYMRCSGYLAKKNQENAKSRPSAASAEQSQKSEETIWELYDRMGIPHKKPEEK